MYSDEEVERISRESNPEPVRWVKSDEIKVSIVEDNSIVRLQCKAVGFPCPVYQWYRNKELLEGVTSNTVDVVRCKCSSDFTFFCVVTNEIEDGHVYSEFYRKPGKEYSSRIVSQTVSLASFVGEEYRCDGCRSGNLENLREIMASMNITTEEKAPIIPVSAYDNEQLVASDKDLKYKTVTLADLTLAEMKFVLKEYKKLLGNGVYAVFYFVGHGFEVNGQCYLLPVEAPSEAHRPEHCLSMDFVLNELSDHNPALNLLLLDVCRKFIPYVADKTIKGEMNGVFMKYLKAHLNQQVSVIKMINDTLR
ncbi:unnamed protein product, partial [Strongylus vulgaris]